jgi:hypothetical protein
MSRLLFAAARGARIQVLGKNIHEFWWNTQDFSKRHSHDYRIHPDDAHLQYGPISTSVRLMAETPWITGYPDNMLLPPHLGFNVCCDTKEQQLEYAMSSGNVKALFLLILSEALADEGL